MDAGTTSVLQTLFRSPSGTPNWVWFIAIFSVLLNLFFPLLITYWLLAQLKKTPTWRGDFQQMVIEHLRAWGHVLSWSFLLFLPGIWKWLSYTFVPFVVLFSRKYQTGQVDALKHSSKLFRKTWWKIIPIILIFSLILPMGLTANFDQYRIIWENPIGALLLGLVDFGFLLLSLVIVFAIFINSLHEVDDEFVF